MGVGSSCAVVSYCGSDGGPTPLILLGLEELDSVELAGAPCSGLSKFGGRHTKSSFVIHASSSTKRPCQLMRQDRVIIENIWSSVKTKSKLTNFMKLI